MKLVVTQPFGSYVVGDEITDSGQMAAALVDNLLNVIKTAGDAPVVSYARVTPPAAD